MTFTALCLLALVAVSLLDRVGQAPAPQRALAAVKRPPTGTRRQRLR